MLPNGDREETGPVALGGDDNDDDEVIFILS